MQLNAEIQFKVDHLINSGTTFLDSYIETINGDIEKILRDKLTIAVSDWTRELVNWPRNGCKYIPSGSFHKIVVLNRVSPIYIDQ